MENNLHRTSPPPRLTAAGDGIAPRAHIQSAGLATCSICLRVQRGSEWIDAEEAILELRSFEQWKPLPLAPALCDDCREDIAARRGLLTSTAA